MYKNPWHRQMGRYMARYTIYSMYKKPMALTNGALHGPYNKQKPGGGVGGGRQKFLASLFTNIAR
jgi:hypothetical protein